MKLPHFSRRDMSWLVLGIGICLIVLWARNSIQTKPDEEFKKLADAQRPCLESLLMEKGTELGTYKATFIDETDLDRRIDYPYIGTIEFDYRIVPKGTGRTVWDAERITAYFRYSKEHRKWELLNIDESEPKDNTLSPDRCKVFTGAAKEADDQPLESRPHLTPPLASLTLLACSSDF